MWFPLWVTTILNAASLFSHWQAEPVAGTTSGNFDSAYLVTFEAHGSTKHATMMSQNKA